MSYVLMVSNGQKYSDFRAWPVAVVSSKEEAGEAVKRFHEWKEKVLEELGEEGNKGYLDDTKFDYMEDLFFDIVPDPPFGRERFEVNLYGNFGEYDCLYYEVDDLKT